MKKMLILVSNLLFQIKNQILDKTHYVYQFSKANKNFTR